MENKSIDTPVADTPAEPPVPVVEEAPSVSPEKKKQKLIVLLCAACVVVAAAAGLFLSRYIPGPGGIHPRNATELDLRDSSITVEQFTSLQAKLPACHIRWSIPVSGNTFDSQSKAIELSSLTVDEVAYFTFFECLETVDATGCTDYEALLALYTQHPELDIRWNLPLAGAEYAQDTTKITLNAANTDFTALAEQLCYLPKLETVIVMGNMDVDTQDMLAQRYPDILFDWTVELCGEPLRSTDTTISFAGRNDLTEANLREIEDNAHRFYLLEAVDLTDCGFEADRLASLRDAIGVDVGWNFDLYGVTVNTLDTSIDLSDIKIKDLSILEDAIPLLTRLERVDMHHCGVDNETMDALNKKYENIRFVWTVRVKGYGVRTDAKYFIVYNCTERYGGDAGTDQLKYCIDLEALDLGHMHLRDISFLQYMPKMKYLIFAECAITDISYIGNLKELEWLELFQASIRDISPLAGCTNLKQLNLCYIHADDSAYDTLVQMPWIERLWYAGHRMSEEQIASLKEALPNTEFYINMGADSTGGSWRYHESYYEMRDAFNMYYMTATGDRTTHKRIDY